MNLFKVNLGRTITVAAVTLLSGINLAFADDYADITKLLKEGQHAAALKQTDAVLKQRPRDAQMRFMKGVILAEQNKTAEAITIFTKLTDDYPNLPEPYNNLAVLYAADNQYEKARIALDKAIRTNPSYATAYENLGDIHAKLASMAYDKALQLNSDNAGAKSKLTMVRSLVASSALPSSARTVTEPANASPANSPTPAPAPATPPAVTVPPVAKAPAPSEKIASISDKNADEKKAPGKVEPKPAPVVASNNADRDAALALVQQWAKAWSAKDVKSYLSFYGNDFAPPKGMSRKEWSQERHARIAGKGRINVKVDSPDVTIKGNTATVTFRQIYDSDRLTATSRKTLVLAKQGNRWQIAQEKTGG